MVKRRALVSILCRRTRYGEVVMGSATIHHPQPIYVFEMMDCLGIERGGGAMPRLALSYATAFHRCESCQCKTACREWLDTKSGGAAFAPPCCPNADILFELQFDQLGHKRVATPEH
jgi:hypothetical protein